jgi:AcrR family transcriptional regulator
MKQTNITTGRVNQKAQTRAKILEAAKALMKRKQAITLDDVAEKANISRATIYRYYSSIDTLIAEVSLDVQHKSPEEIAEEVKNMSFEERLFFIQQYYNELAQKNETAFRRYLSVVLSESVSSKKKLRGARRLKSLSKALKPYNKDMDKESYTKLLYAATLLTGIESLIVCKDVCELNNEESNNVLQWAMQMILKGINS